MSTLVTVSFDDVLWFTCVYLTEVVYAVESRKEIIPLMVERHFEPHGWLKFHMSDKLRLDFSCDDIFLDSMKRLLSMLRKTFLKTTSCEFVCCQCSLLDFNIIFILVISI